MPFDAGYTPDPPTRPTMDSGLVALEGATFKQPDASPDARVWTYRCPNNWCSTSITCRADDHIRMLTADEALRGHLSICRPPAEPEAKDTP